LQLSRARIDRGAPGVEAGLAGGLIRMFALLPGAAFRDRAAAVDLDRIYG
jgi:hypothetical protein